MSKIYRAKYKCRLCGEVYYDALIQTAFKAAAIVAEISVFGKSLHDKNTSLYGIHFCEGYTCGISDFVGVEAIGDDDEKQV